jgi:diazepam-binding inhibitor (GABA receptor modulating acyl-CoA-binding protein)
MSELSSNFKKAAEEAQNLPERPDNQTLLKLYAFYKQATVGDITGKRPGFTDMVGRAKYDSWKKLRGLSQEGAMQAYIDLVEKLKE